MAKKKKGTARNNGKPQTKKTAKKQAAKAVVRELPIKRHVAPSDKATFANHVVVRAEPATFQLFFFDIQPPLVLEGDLPEIKKEADDKKYVDAYCVSRITIPHHIMPQFIKALQQNFDRQKDILATIVEMES